MGARGANDGDHKQKLLRMKTTFTDGNLGHQFFDSCFCELVFSAKGYHCTLVVSVLFFIICMCAAFLCSTSRLPLCDTHSLSSEGDAAFFEQVAILPCKDVLTLSRLDDAYNAL